MHGIGRRGFLSFLGIGVAGAMMPEVLTVNATLFKGSKPPLSMDAVNIQTLTEAMSAEFERIYGSLCGRSVAFGNGVRVGERLGREVVTLMDHQMAAFVDLPEVSEGMLERYIIPAAEALAHECANNRINVFGTLSYPLRDSPGVESIAANVSTGVTSIRGIVHSYYNPVTDRLETQLRFDAIGGRA